MLSELRTRKLTRFFRVVDRDGDGILTLADPEIVVRKLASLRELRQGTTSYESFRDGFMAYWSDLMKRSDGDEDGVVTLREWLDYHDEMLADETRFEYTVAFSAGIMFALMDTDEDGTISLDEYGEWMKAWGIDEDDLTPEVFAGLDRNGDGILSQTEVLDMVREFYYSDDPDAPGNWCMGPF